MIKNRILLAICGGIAAYKSAELVRLLVSQYHCEVKVVMTEAATEFISPLTFQALSGHSVTIQMLATKDSHAMAHIDLVRWANQLLVAPATANHIAKFSYGLADDLLSTLYLAADCPVYLAPAMNQAMWHHPATQENIQRLKQRGVQIIGPESGEQACGEIGLGRMLAAEEICQYLIEPANQSLLGQRLLITAGPTQEPLDPVRYLTNRSSGKMGYALAEAALKAGGQVTLVSGPTTLIASHTIHTIQVKTTEQMYQAVISRVADYDIYIGAAAVADYRPINTQTDKIKKNSDYLHIELKRNPDILASVAQLSDRPHYVVGFAAETHNLAQYARQKLEQNNLDMIAANWVGKPEGGFDKDDNALEVYWHGGHRSLGMTTKQQLAEQLITLIAQKINEQ